MVYQDKDHRKRAAQAIKLRKEAQERRKKYKKLYAESEASLSAISAKYKK